MAIERILVLDVFDDDLKTLTKKHRRLAPLWDAVDAITRDDRDLLATKYRDHRLTGPWSGYRELHVAADWLLIYRIEADELILVLTRTGTHDTLYSKRTGTNRIRAYDQAEGRLI